MNNSFSDLLPELRPYLPCALVDDPWLGLRLRKAIEVGKT